MGKLLSSIIAFLFRGAVIKGTSLLLFFYLISSIIPHLLKFLPQSTNLPELWSLLPDSIIYFINYFNFVFGIKLVLSSLVTRFTIRRIPFLG